MLNAKPVRRIRKHPLPVPHLQAVNATLDTLAQTAGRVINAMQESTSLWWEVQVA